MIRFRATYQRRIEEQSDGTTVHTLGYPEQHELFLGFARQVFDEIGTVVEYPDGMAVARASDGTHLGLVKGADTAIDALIKYDQARETAADTGE